jgi:NhaC family Na+:H+ antiporter
MIVGPILNRRLLRDKLSPISDPPTARRRGRDDLMEHVHSMVYVIVPHHLSCVIYGVMGWKYGGASVDMSALSELSSALHGSFWLNPLLLIPILILGLCIFKKMGSIQALGLRWPSA